MILGFDGTRAIRRLALEVEEPDVSRTQELQLAVSTDGRRTYQAQPSHDHVAGAAVTGLAHAVRQALISPLAGWENVSTEDFEAYIQRLAWSGDRES